MKTSMGKIVFRRSAPLSQAATAPVVSAKARWYPLLICVLLAALTLGTFSRAVWECGFTNYDDDVYVTDNLFVRFGLTWAGALWAFTALHGSNWHPLTWLSHMLDVQLYGIQPWGHHLTSVLLHAANAALLFWLLKKMTGALWRSALVAALFALHPLRVESVAWVAERKDVLSAFFGFLSLIFYTRYVGQASRLSPSFKPQEASPRQAGSLSYAMALFFFALGLMSKPMLVTWPFVMLLLDWWPLKRLTIDDWRLAIGGLVWEKIPFFALSAASCLVTFIAQTYGRSVQSFEKFPLVARLENTVVSFARYLVKIFWPFDLAAPYPHPGHWPATFVAGSVVLLIALTAFVLWQRNRRPYLLVGWLLFVGTLMPVIGLVQVGAQSMADRYTYLPSMGISLAVVWLAFEVATRWRIPKTAFAAVICVTLGLCVARSIDQTACWNNSETLFRHAIAVTGGSGTAFNNLAIYLLGRPGHTSEAVELFRKVLQTEPDNAETWSNLALGLDDLKQYDEAIAAHETALRLKPDRAEIHVGYGGLLIDLGRGEQAIAELRKAVRLAPDNPKAYGELGRAFNAQQNYDEAIRSYQMALRLAPYSGQLHNDLGLVFAAQGRRDDAVAQYRAALRADPQFEEAYNNLGAALMVAGQLDEAIRLFNQLLQLNPDHARAHDNLGIALAMLGRLDESANHLREAIRRDPDSATTHFNLGNVLAMQRKLDEAVAEYTITLRLQPEDAPAHFNLANALAELGRRAEAVQHLNETLRLNPDNTAARQKLRELGVE